MKRGAGGTICKWRESGLIGRRREPGKDRGKKDN